MKEEKGVTLTSLVVYVIAMVIVIGIMNSIINHFYNNTEDINAAIQEIIEFNKFNIYFLKEVKLKGNAIDNISTEDDNQYILFTSGNSFVFDNNKIYYNNIEICKNVISANFSVVEDVNGVEENDTIIKAELKFKNYYQAINYKIESIY